MTEKGLPSDDHKNQRYAAIGVAVVYFLVGVPLWWKTTEVYKVQLPYTDIDSLSREPVFISFDIKIHVANEFKKTIPTFIASLESKLYGKPDSSGMSTNYRIKLANNNIDGILEGSKSIEDLESKFVSQLNDRKTSHVQNILILPSSIKFQQSRVYLGTSRVLFVKYTGDEDTSSILSKIIKDVIVRESSILKKYALNHDLPRQSLPDKENMRSIRSSSAYDVTFTLVINEPHIYNVRWDIKQHIRDYLNSFVSSLPISFNIKSQVLAYTGMSVKSFKSSSRGSKEFNKSSASFCHMIDLPHMINPIESKLGSHVSTNLGLEFIVYIPLESQNPLYILDSHGNQVQTNSFLSPQWGGILIYNIPKPPLTGPHPYTVDIDGAHVMGVFLAQLRLLIGIPHKTDDSDIQLSPLPHTAIYDWEIDAFARIRSVENIVRATSTLQSLAKLLSEIKNIVINDEIGREVQKAVDNIKVSHGNLAEGQVLDAFLSSQVALFAAEKAFFDPSLLELLYFPEDQKFAIYIPLFLPISIPVFASMYKVIQWFKRRKEENKLKKNE